MGVDDVEALIIAWSRLFTKGAVENLGASLRSSVVYGDLIKYLSQQLERLEGPRSGNVGEATFGEKIDNATILETAKQTILFGDEYVSRLELPETNLFDDGNNTDDSRL